MMRAILVTAAVLSLVVAACQTTPARPKPPREAIGIDPAAELLPPGGDGRAAGAHRLMAIHTEVLVIALTCKDYVGIPTLHWHYTNFTAAIAGPLIDAQAVLTPLAPSDGLEPGVPPFDAYRTALANREARKAQLIGSWDYCWSRIWAFADVVKWTAADAARFMNRTGI